jgi:F0F1-type ATP synthase assembly protein I
MDSQQENRKKLAAAMVVGTEMGLMIAISLVGFLLAGLWLDKRLGTIPLFTIIFVVASMFSVAAEMRYIILPILEKRSQSKDNKNNK